MTPDVSVLTPSFGYAHFLRDSIESVRLQEGVTTEHIVQDGCSTDGTVELLKEYDDELVWRSEPDEGQSDALNRAFLLANGRWIAWLNADEFYLPDSLARLVDAGDRTGADLVYGDTAFVDGGGRLTRLLPQHRYNGFVLRQYGTFVSTVSMIIRRSSLGDVPIDVTMKRMMDWDLFMRLAKQHASFEYVPETIGAFREHDTRITATERRGFLQRLNHDDGFGREYAMVRDRYGALRMRRVGTVMHGAEKLAAGSYRRQMRARSLRGADLRWFRSETAAADYRSFHDHCYGSSEVASR